MRVRKRKGISYILEVAMMTLVVVALATVVLTWGLGQVSNSRIALTGAVNDRIARSQEVINIEDVQMLSSTTMRVYIRNIGSIQVLIDSVYVNNANTPILGICPAGSFQSGIVSVSAGLSSVAVTLPAREPSASYSASGASTTAGWAPVATLAGSPAPTQTNFTLTLSVAAPGGGGTINWYTNYASCSSAVAPPAKLSLSINGEGAVDVTVSPAPVTATGGTGTVGTGSTSTVVNGAFGGTNNYQNDIVWITGQVGVGQCRVIQSNTPLALTLATAWNITPVGGLSTYAISSAATTGPPLCSGNSYTVTASTNRGTTSSGAFTV